MKARVYESKIWLSHTCINFLSAVILICAITISCKDDEPDEVEQLHECVEYEPSIDDGDLGGVWEDPFDEDEYSFTVPNDPGGGYVHVSHSSPVDIIPTQNTNVNPPIAGTITGGSAATTANEQIRVDVFEVAPGQSYHVLVTQFWKAPAELYPLGYSGSWTYHSRVDCYEPNDNFDQAKAIPTGEIIEAYGIAGFRDYFIRSGDPHTKDWFRFSLPTAMEVDIEFLQVAQNQQVNLLLFNSSEQVIFSISADEGATFIHNAGILDAGTWYLQVHPIPDTRKAQLSDGDEIPDHFDTPYQFVINVK